MSDPETRTDRPRNRSRARIAFWIAGGALALGLLVLIRGISSGPDGAPDPTGRVRIESLAAPEPAAAKPEQAPDSSAVPEIRIPHGTLVARVGGPEHLCSQQAWAGLSGVMREVGQGEVVVDRDAWNRRTLQTRVGLASWFSQCVSAGGPVVIRDGAGERLAGYDSANGLTLGN